MDDWPPDDTIIDDEERPEPDDEPSASVRHDRFSRVVGDALESGPRNDRFERML